MAFKNVRSFNVILFVCELTGVETFFWQTPHDIRSDEMKFGRLVPLSLAVFLSFGIAGCSDTGIGAGVGAGGGALVGSTVGHPWSGALAGGAGGAVVGHEIGKNKNNNDD
jgi:hypothetical protein